jgi:UDP-3-O-[3-hydroxymyristoyl] glucosamine N-acyltransferase
MTDVVIIGASRFATEIARYVTDCGHKVVKFLSLDGERIATPENATGEILTANLPRKTKVVLAVADAARRAALVEQYVDVHCLDAINIIHPTSRLDEALDNNRGNIIGPGNYFGVGVNLGNFNIINYRSTVGNYSSLGSMNFISPDFHCANSVQIGSGNFIGIGCRVVPEVEIGDDCRVQAGLTIHEDLLSSRSYVEASRIKSFPISL